MKRSGRAWIFLPAVIIAAAVIGVVVSSYQQEIGLMEAHPGGLAAVAMAGAARDLSSGSGPDDYWAFSDALLAATVAQINMPVINAADTRLEHTMVQAIDCLKALREAWQAEIDEVWDPEIQGVPTYWEVLHPTLDVTGNGPLTPSEVRDICRDQAGEILEEARDLAE